MKPVILKEVLNRFKKSKSLKPTKSNCIPICLTCTQLIKKVSINNNLSMEILLKETNLILAWNELGEGP